MRRISCLVLAVWWGLASAPNSFPQTPDRAWPVVPVTLGRLIQQSSRILLLEVESTDRDQHLVVYRIVTCLKGTDAGGRIVDRLSENESPAEARAILDWAEPGKSAVAFEDRFDLCVCLGNCWYGAAKSENAACPSIMSRIRPELAAAYVGPVKRLREHIQEILVGREVVITAREIRQVIHEWDSPPPVPLDWPHGQKGRVWRIKASLKIDDVEATGSEEGWYFVGWGTGDPGAAGERIRALRNNDAALRAEAAEDLGQVLPPSEAALAALHEAVHDPDGHVRIHAAKSLLRIDGQSAAAIALLERALVDRETELRLAATAAWAELAPMAGPAVPGLVAALNDPDPTVRHLAAFALGEKCADAPRSGNPAMAVAAALGKIMLEDREQDVRHQAVYALLQMGTDARGPLAGLMQALRTADGNIPELAADLLARLGPAGVEALAGALQVDDYTVRPKAIEFLGNLGPQAKAAIPALMGALQEVDPRLRHEAALALLRIDPLLGLRAAAEVLSEPSKELRYSGPSLMKALGAMGPQASPLAPSVVRLLRNGNSDVQECAARCLGEMGPKARWAAPALRGALRDLVAGVRIAAARALGDMGYATEAAEALTRELKDPLVWDVVAPALAEIGPAARVALPALREALRNENKLSRWELAFAIWRIEDRPGAAATESSEALDILIEMLPQRDSAETRRALHFLSQSPAAAARAVPALIEALKNEDAYARSFAATNLTAFGAGAKTAVPALRTALTVSDIDARGAIAAALFQIAPEEADPCPLCIERLEWDLVFTPEYLDRLAEMGPRAKRAVPWLRRLLRRPEYPIYWKAAKALREIDPETAASHWGTVPPVPDGQLPVTALSAPELKTLWGDLAGDDVPRAYRALWVLVSARDQAVAFLGQRLRPVTAVPPARIARLIAELDSDQFSVRSRATAALEEIAEQAEPALTDVLAGRPSLEVRRRVERILEGMVRERRRGCRALKALAEIGTAQTRRLLADLADGEPGSVLTRFAQDGLEGRVPALIERP